MANERYRNLGSRCIVYSSWTPVSKKILAGQARPTPKSRGQVEIRFRRNPAKYTYQLNTLFTLEKWQSWMRGGVGSKWNRLYLGRV